MVTPQATPSSKNTHGSPLISTLLVIAIALALAGLMYLLEVAGLSPEIIGTFVLALAVGGRIVQMLGSLGSIAEGSLTRLGYVATALGAASFEQWSLRIWVVAAALGVMAIFDYIEYRVKGRTTL